MPPPEPTRPLLLGDEAPNFTAHTPAGDLDFHRYLGDSWGILFSHPRDFTPVCSTELVAIARLRDAFARRGTKVAVLAIGSAQQHGEWAEELSATFDVGVDFPLIGDDGMVVARLYGMVHPNASEDTTVRSVHVIDPAKRVRLVISYPHTTGRNFDEILRVLDSLQLADRAQVVTPADWQPGERALVPHDVPDADADARFGDVERVLPYIRRVDPTPNRESTT